MKDTGTCFLSTKLSGRLNLISSCFGIVLHQHAGLGCLHLRDRIRKDCKITGGGNCKDQAKARAWTRLRSAFSLMFETKTEELEACAYDGDVDEPDGDDADLTVR